MDAVDVLFVCHALGLLHDECACRGTGVFHQIHGTDIDDGLAFNGRMLVVRAPEPYVLRLNGKVKLLEDTLIAALEDIAHLRRLPGDDVVEYGLFAEYCRVNVWPQDLDDTVNARQGAVLCLDVAEERLADGRRAKHLLDLYGENLAVGTVDEFKQLGLDGFLRNRCKAALHVLEGVARLRSE